MPTVVSCPLPPSALLLASQAAGAFVDCYMTEVAGTVGHAAFVEAFYTTWLFKLERLLLGWLARRPTSDRQAMELATGGRDNFAVWHVEHRRTDQLLLAEETGRTKSWLMTEPQGMPEAADTAPRTRLYFGSALLPRTDRQTGQRRFGILFHLLLGFHRAYSKALLRAGAARVTR
jgi:hypothetical protein